MKFLHKPRRVIAIAAVGCACAVGAGLTWVGAQTSTLHHVYQYMAPPGQLGPPMYETSHQILFDIQPWASGETAVALKYLRSHYDPYYWSFSAGAPITGTTASVFRIFPFGNSYQGVGDTFGLSFPPSQTLGVKTTIELERIFRGSTRTTITTSGTPFTNIGTAYTSLGWPFSCGMLPDIDGVISYQPAGCTWLGDLFVVEHFQYGSYHSVILHDVYGQQTDYSYAGYSDGNGWPYDPDTGFNHFYPPPAVSGPPPPENDTVQTGDPIISAPCTGGIWYPEGAPTTPGQTVPNLPCYADPIITPVGSGSS